MTLPLILTMIVRDEAATIAETLASVRPLIQGWAIVDTGSVDGTQDAVREALRGVPGKLIQQPWPESFAVARTWAWDLAEELCEGEDHWRFEVSGDTVAHGTVDLVRHHIAGPDGLWVESRMGNITWRRPKITRSGRGWRYKGRLHEIADLPRANLDARMETAHGLWLEHRGRPQGLPAQGGRSKYLSMMMADLEESPDDPRTVFYAAQTLELEGRWGEARALYEKRIRMAAEGKGWNQEAYIAALRVARGCAALGMDDATVRSLFARAVSICPERPEALEELGKMAPEADTRWLFAERVRALVLEEPRHTGFPAISQESMRKQGIVGFTHTPWGTLPLTGPRS